MKNSVATLIGNVTKDPEVKKIGQAEAIVFSMAVNTGEKDAASNEYITNFYEVTWFCAQAAREYFMSRAQKGTQVMAYGTPCMYSYFSKKDNVTKYGLKLRANDVTPLNRLKTEGNRGSSRTSAADDDYADL